LAFALSAPQRANFFPPVPLPPCSALEYLLLTATFTHRNSLVVSTPARARRASAFKPMASVQMPSPTDGGGDLSPTGNNPGISANTKMRKRTKTGCLTCRKRRIKCGEERPTCGNCIKSKRQCEGYNQRVIFKTPIENWPNHPGNVSTIQYHTSMLPGSGRNQSFRSPSVSTRPQESSLTSIRPRPMGSYDFSAVDPSSGTGLAISPHSYVHETSYQQPLPSPHHQQPLVSPHHHSQASTAPSSYFPHPSPVLISPSAQYTHEPNIGYQAPAHYDESRTLYQQMPVSYDSSLEPRSAVSLSMPQQPLYQHHSTTHSEDQNSYRSHSSVSPRSDHYIPYTDATPVLQPYNSHAHTAMQQAPVSSADMSRVGPYTHPAAVSNADFSRSSYSSVQIPMHDLNQDVKYMPQAVLGMSHV
jgi:hypothetical protein